MQPGAEGLFVQLLGYQWHIVRGDICCPAVDARCIHGLFWDKRQIWNTRMLIADAAVNSVHGPENSVTWLSSEALAVLSLDTTCMPIPDVHGSQGISIRLQP